MRSGVWFKALQRIDRVLFDLTVVRKLQVEQSGDNMLIYCSYIAPEHQALVDSSEGVIYIESKPE